MNSDRNYIVEFFVMWLKVGGVYLIISSLSDRVYGLLAASFIFGITFFNKVVRFNLFGNHDAVIIFWLLKVILSSLIGIIAFPIVNGYYILNILIMIFRMLIYKSNGKKEKR